MAWDQFQVSHVWVPHCRSGRQGAEHPWRSFHRGLETYRPTANHQHRPLGRAAGGISLCGQQCAGGGRERSDWRIYCAWGHNDGASAWYGLVLACHSSCPALLAFWLVWRCLCPVSSVLYFESFKRVRPQSVCTPRPVITSFASGHTFGGGDGRTSKAHRVGGWHCLWNALFLWKCAFRQNAHPAPLHVGRCVPKEAGPHSATHPPRKTFPNAMTWA